MISNAVNESQSDYVTFDVESMPDFYSWVEVSYTSENFAKRRLSGESDSDAAFRIAEGWMGGVAAAAQKVQPHIRPYMYNILASFDAGIGSTTWEMAE
eukprot:SAG31_NODE_10242_length_1165_cov_1.389306_2_plen_97_part_01